MIYYDIPYYYYAILRYAILYYTIPILCEEQRAATCSWDQGLRLRDTSLNEETYGQFS